MAEYLYFILTFVAGMAGGSFLTVKITKSKTVKGNSSLVDQSKARAAGDIIGGNKG